jgi:xanthine dehydrogenase accessory factor
LSGAEPSPAAELADLARNNGRGALATVVGPEGDEAIGRKLIVRVDGSSSGSLGVDGLDAEARAVAEELLWAERSELVELHKKQVFVDVVAPPPRLLILGAVDYAAALCKLARAA